mmetsp:Transcript_55360/g.152445  ORF Transcript_55360/g.152445 Transcript_55360/m.152445 type:complete len:143 (+) Transcript_55360:256-684(+)
MPFAQDDITHNAERAAQMAEVIEHHFQAARARGAGVPAHGCLMHGRPTDNSRENGHTRLLERKAKRARGEATDEAGPAPVARADDMWRVDPKATARLPIMPARINPTEAHGPLAQRADESDYEFKRRQRIQENEIFMSQLRL